MCFGRALSGGWGAGSVLVLVAISFTAARVSAAFPVALGPKSPLICAELSSSGIFSPLIHRWGAAAMGRGGRRARLRGTPLPSHSSVPPAASPFSCLPGCPGHLRPRRCSQIHSLISPVARGLARPQLPAPSCPSPDCCIDSRSNHPTGNAVSRNCCVF